LTVSELEETMAPMLTEQCCGLKRKIRNPLAEKRKGSHLTGHRWASLELECYVVSLEIDISSMVVAGINEDWRHLFIEPHRSSNIRRMATLPITNHRTLTSRI